MKVPAGKTATQVVTEEPRHRLAGAPLTNSNDDQMRIFINSTASSPKVKEGAEAGDRPAAGLLNKTRREI